MSGLSHTHLTGTDTDRCNPDEGIAPRERERNGYRSKPTINDESIDSNDDNKHTTNSSGNSGSSEVSEWQPMPIGAGPMTVVSSVHISDTFRSQEQLAELKGFLSIVFAPSSRAMRVITPADVTGIQLPPSPTPTAIEVTNNPPHRVSTNRQRLHKQRRTRHQYEFIHDQFEVGDINSRALERNHDIVDDARYIQILESPGRLLLDNTTTMSSSANDSQHFHFESLRLDTWDETDEDSWINELQVSGERAETDDIGIGYAQYLEHTDQVEQSIEDEQVAKAQRHLDFSMTAGGSAKDVLTVDYSDISICVSDAEATAVGEGNAVQGAIFANADQEIQEMASTAAASLFPEPSRPPRRREQAHARQHAPTSSSLASSLPSTRRKQRSDTSRSQSGIKFRQYQSDQWDVRYHELIQFHKHHGHCIVGSRDGKTLSHWVKRQRYLYKQKQDGRHSTLTDERQARLERLGFVWDSHDEAWENRFNDLMLYRARHGHTNVPAHFSEQPPLGIWAKVQRRQYRLYRSGQRSTLTERRIERLNEVGFPWLAQPNQTAANRSSKKRK